MREKGQTMIEVLLALAIGAIIIAGIGKAINTSLSSSQFGKNQSLANQYAQEAMEIVKTLKPTANSYCLPKGQTTLGSGDTENITTGCSLNVDDLVREVNIQTGDVKKITVTVGWSDSKCYAPAPTPTPRISRPAGVQSVGNVIPTPTAVPTITSCDSAASTSYLSSDYCHRVQLVSCYSDTEVVPTP